MRGVTAYPNCSVPAAASLLQQSGIAAGLPNRAVCSQSPLLSGNLRGRFNIGLHTPTERTTAQIRGPELLSRVVPADMSLVTPFAYEITNTTFGTIKRRGPPGRTVQQLHVHRAFATGFRSRMSPATNVVAISFCDNDPYLA